MQACPSLSIIVEWENAKSADARRGRAMLVALTEQLNELRAEQPVNAELFLIHDADETDPAEMTRDLQPLLASFPGPVTFLPCRDLDYYDQKNFGVQQAKNDVVLMIDCDVIPRPGWLRNMLLCFLEENADLVSGATLIEQRNLYEKAFALWFFPLASEVPERRRAERFYANNVLMRADVLRATPFPASDLIRGKCRALAEQLRTDHRIMMIEPRAKVEHPAPNGLGHFIKRALCHGHDDALLHNYDGLRPAYWRCRSRMQWVSRRIMEHRGEVGLGWWGGIGAVGIALAYFSFIFVGELISQLNPALIRNRLRV